MIPGPGDLVPDSPPLAGPEYNARWITQGRRSTTVPIDRLISVNFSHNTKCKLINVRRDRFE